MRDLCDNALEITARHLQRYVSESVTIFSIVGWTECSLAIWRPRYCLNDVFSNRMENKTRADPGHDLEFFITNSFACLRLKRVESVAEQNKIGRSSVYAEESKPETNEGCCVVALPTKILVANKRRRKVKGSEWALHSDDTDLVRTTTVPCHWIGCRWLGK